MPKGKKFTAAEKHFFKKEQRLNKEIEWYQSAYKILRQQNSALADQLQLIQSEDWKAADPLKEKEDADLTKLRESVARYYGFPAQLQKLGEECTELACETIHHKKKTQLHPNTANADLKSEMADVLNMVEQICYLSNCREEVEKIALGKMQRQIKRIQTAQDTMRDGLNG